MKTKKIVLSTLTIFAVAAVVVGATTAFFSDTETSTGNTFAAGEIDLKIDSQSHYAGLTCTGNLWVDDGQTTRPDLVGAACGGTWTETDLGANHQFFDFADVKPGDEGENTISIHVYDNDSWLRYRSDNAIDYENTCNEAEVEAGDTSCNAQEGELSANLDWHVWLDQGVIPGFQNVDANGNPISTSASTYDSTEGDNIQNGPIEFTVLGGDDVDGGTDGLYPFRDGTQYHFAESLVVAYGLSGCVNESTDGHNGYGDCQGLAADGRIVGSTTYYFGTAWCVGTFEDGGSVLDAPDSCDGSTASNQAQGDSFVADSVYEVVQHRNNPNAIF